MDITYAPQIGDRVFLHDINDNTIGRFYSVLDINGETMAIQACEICGDHLEETNNLDIVLLTWDKKSGNWQWRQNPNVPIKVATFMNPTEKLQEFV